MPINASQNTQFFSNSVGFEIPSVKLFYRQNKQKILNFN